MTTVTGNALVLCHRLVLNLVSSRFGCNLGMAVQTDLSGFAFEEFILFCSMRDMASVAITFGKRRVSRLFCLLVGQLRMTGQAEFTLRRCQFHHSGYFTAVWSMAAHAVSPGKGPMLSVEPFLCLGITMAFKTKLRLALCEQRPHFRFMCVMTVEAEALFCRGMRVLGICISVSVVTRITDCR